MMQSASPIRRCLALLLAFAVFAVAGIQIAHWDNQQNVGQAAFKLAQNADGLCPICYSVPVGHGAAPAIFHLVRFEGHLRVVAVAAQREGVQPEFHLHIRPPPSLA